jgi:hypothetical protein
MPTPGSKVASPRGGTRRLDPARWALLKMKNGCLEDYSWYDLDDLPLRDLVRLISSDIIGLQAVNTSWDSGILIPSEEQFRCGWTVARKAAVSPRIDCSLISVWPTSHDAYCDEWWFFRDVPPAFDFTHGICNMISARIGQWKDVEFSTHFAENIRRFRPEVIVGNNQWSYCVMKHPSKELSAQPAAGGYSPEDGRKTSA